MVSRSSVDPYFHFWTGLGLLMGKLRQFLTELSARNIPKFLFPDDNLSKNSPNMVCVLILWRAGL